MTPVGPHRAGFGESAFWSVQDGAVWWIDLHGRSLLKTHEDGRTWVFKTPGFPANNPRAVVPGAGGRLIAALDDRLARFDPSTGAFTYIDLDLPVPPGHVLNDAVVDPAGRLIIGTVRAAGGDDDKGVILSIGPDGPVRVLTGGLCIPNGLAFSPDGRTIYFSDSHRDVKTVWQAVYDPMTGDIGPCRIFVGPDDFAGRPDGAAMDSEGGYWIAALEAGRVHRYGPDGRFDLSVEVPTSMPSKPCFAGANLDHLYVTTAGTLAGLDDGKAGALYAARTHFRGAPPILCGL